MLGVASSATLPGWERAVDALHVAAALELSAEKFWTFDERLGKLAKAVGLKLV